MNTRRLALSAGAVAASAGLYYSFTSGAVLDPWQSYKAQPPTSVQRTVFIGDLHSDLKQTLSTFRLAGLIAPDGTDWTGGNTTFVQTGDCVDRGNETKDIYALIEKLRSQAPQAGGQIISLLGNHEVRFSLL